MAFRSAIYIRWVHASWVGRHSGWKIDDDELRSWRYCSIGLVLILFGLFSLAMFIYIDFFQNK